MPDLNLLNALSSCFKNEKRRMLVAKFVAITKIL